jgi:hypothetical protein
MFLVLFFLCFLLRASAPCSFLQCPRAELRSLDHSFRSFPSFFPRTYPRHGEGGCGYGEARGAHCDPGGTGMLKARLGVHLFACWPRRDNFVTQEFYSIWALPTGVAAERTGSTEACPTPTSSRGRRRGSCALAGPELNCGLRHFPRCSSVILR